MKSWKIGAIAGGLAGIVGAWLISEYDFSLFSVILIGAIIGVLIGFLVNFVKRKKNKVINSKL